MTKLNFECKLIHNNCLFELKRRVRGKMVERNESPRSASKENPEREKPEENGAEDGKPYNGYENYMSEERDSDIRKRDDGFEKRDKSEEGSERGRDRERERDRGYTSEEQKIERSRTPSQKGSDRFKDDQKSPRSISDRQGSRSRSRSRSGERYNRRGGRDGYGSPRGAAAQPDEEYTQLYVNGLPRNVRYDEVKYLFEGCGEIGDISIKTKYAFINFKRHEDAVHAIKELNNYNF